VPNRPEQPERGKEDITQERSLEAPDKERKEKDKDRIDKAKINFEKNIADIERLEAMLWNRMLLFLQTYLLNHR
jgi:hypothetical protein